jgi:hypothetical protein
MMNPAGFFVCLKKKYKNEENNKKRNQWNQQNMDSRGRVWETEVGLGNTLCIVSLGLQGLRSRAFS